MRNYQTKQNAGGAVDSINSERFGAGEFNSIAVELENAVSTSGQTLAPADGTGEVSTQLAKAQAIYGAGGASFMLDTGAVNAYVLNPVSPKEVATAYFNGMTIFFEPGTDNTGAATVNVASIGIKSITDANGDPLLGGEITATCAIKYNSIDDRFELLWNNRYLFAKGTVNFYVDGSLGNDANSGRASGAAAFATIQKAINYVSALVLTNATIIINVADGTYAEALILKQNFSAGIAGSTTPIIQGNAGDNTAVSIAPGAGSCVTGVGVSSPWHFKDLEFTSATASGVIADFGTVIYLENVNFDTCNDHHVLAEWGSKVEFINDGYTISGGAVTHAYAVRNSMILMQGGNTLTISGSPAFTYFAYAGRFCIVDYTSVTFSGSATGYQAGQEHGGRVVDAYLLPGDTQTQNLDYSEDDTLSGSAVSLTTGTPVNVASLSLPPGEYDVWGFAVFQGAGGTTVNYIVSSISSVSATLTNEADQIDWRFLNGGTPFAVTNDVSANCGPNRVLLNSTTTIYLTAQAGFAVDACSVYGLLRARRITEF